ncbi:response regulator transcription factor [Idiomarina xiamenensis]|uniref:Response regulator n=1 Tax=Idiomarina xiamenensis 10-D-4 TaxID=740709 RepID=K2LB77_9GAMM|nr:response regulator transcription factor [Idiomarina xiamenensis]EKE87060.1 response regulator [Idiomarina xiamenensis 10-D-4]
MTNELNPRGRRLLLVEDQTMVRNALAALLRLESDFHVVEVSDGAEAIQQLTHDSAYDVVLSDIEMPNVSGIELAQWLTQQQPQLPLVIITTFGRSGYIRRAIDAGVRGFLLKDAPINDLLTALTTVLQGQRVIDNSLLLQALGEQDPLSDKERRALALAAEGLSTSAIAAQLFIAEGTARNYLSEAISKLHASNRIDAARIARQNGWL